MKPQYLGSFITDETLGSFITDETLRGFNILYNNLNLSDIWKLSQEHVNHNVP